MKRNILLVAMLFFIPFLTFAQAKKKKTTKEKREREKSDIQIFDDSGVDIFKEKNVIDYRNILKISPLVAIVGEFPIFHERVINEKLSLELGAGVNFISPSSANNLDNRVFFGVDFPTNIVLDKSNVKPYFGASMRYFVSTRRYVAPEGTYLSVGTKWRQFSFNSHLDNESFPFDPDRKSTATQFDMFRLMVGKSRVRDWFYTDIAIGIAARRKTLQFWEYDVANNFEIVKTSFSSISPAILLGVKFGVVLK
jgi:hypothetical protein